MDDSKTTRLLYFVVVLTCINVALTSFLLFDNYQAGTPSSRAVTKSPITNEQAATVAKRMVEAYNSGSTETLYAQFDELAKIQFSIEALAEQAKKLRELLGSIDRYVFDQAVPAGTQSGKEFYTLTYKVKLVGKQFSTGEMKITVALNNGKLSVYGFFINGLSETKRSN